MAEGSPRPVPDSSQTPTRTPGPTLAEQAFDANRAAFALSAKYPVRRVAVLTPEQLAAARAQLGPAAFMLPKAANRNDVERRPLTRDELLDARAAAFGQ